MIDISLRFRDSDFKRIERNLANIMEYIRQDAERLGYAGYKYIKTLIPISNLSHPHLRESFKVTTQRVIGPGILIAIRTDRPYAPYVDQGTVVPTRYARNKKAMRFIGSTGDVVFAHRASGFTTKGVHYTEKGEAWMGKNASHYIDLTLRRYLRR